MIYNNFRIYITENCNAKCPNCFNSKIRNDRHMDIVRFEELCKFLSNNNCTQIKIMGGEPTIHPQFSDFMKLSQTYFETVSLFTNAISDKIYEYKPRETDIITYNFRFRGLLNKERLLLEYPGLRNLEIQITPNIIKERLVKDIIKVVSLEPKRIRPCLTLDCTANIFNDRETLISIYEYVWKSCCDMGFDVGQDHLIPLCFIQGTKIPMRKSGVNCTIDCAGLIDADFNLKFCNQHSDCLINIFTDDKKIVSNEVINKQLEKKYNSILKRIEDKGCADCSMYGIYCNGGCFIGKDVISKVYPKF